MDISELCDGPLKKKKKTRVDLATVEEISCLEAICGRYYKGTTKNVPEKRLRLILQTQEPQEKC